MVSRLKPCPQLARQSEPLPQFRAPPKNVLSALLEAQAQCGDQEGESDGREGASAEGKAKDGHGSGVMLPTTDTPTQSGIEPLYQAYHLLVVMTGSGAWLVWN
jgi:hypothetical protein